MGNLLRLLGFYLCIPIYKAILSLYEIFYYLASARFFEDSSIIDSLSSNLYVLISVVMLFAFSATMIAAIVNPDLIEDKKKGVGAIFKRGLIGIVLIVVIPFAFDKIYEYQAKILDSHIIEKTLVGMQFNNDDKNTGGNGGKVIAGSLISSVIYPDVDSENGSVTIETVAGREPQESYNDMVSDVSTMGSFSDYINAEKSGSDDYAFEFNGIIAIIAGIAADYILLIFAIDMAVRLFKLAFYELTAPISIMAYIAAGGDVFAKWAKAVGETFLEVFIRVGAMALYLFFISHLNDFANSKTWSAAGFEGLGWLLLKLLLIIGMLIFVNKIPDLIKKAFGFEIPKTGGIKGRLNNMAGVGKQASEAWGKVTKAAGRVAGYGALGVGAAATLGVGGAALGAAGGYLAKKNWEKGLLGQRALKDTGFGQQITETGHKLRKTGAWLQGGRKGLEEYNKNDPVAINREYEREIEMDKKIKTKVLAEIEAAAKDVPEVKFKADNNGNRVLDIDSMPINNTGTSTFAKMVNNTKLSTSQKEALVDFNEKQNKLMSAQQDESKVDQIKSLLERAMNATNDDILKSNLNNALGKLEAGNIKANDFKSYLQGSEFNGMTNYDTIEKILDGYKDKDGNSRIIDSTVKLTANVTNAQSAFDTASSKLDTAIEKASSKENKQMLKEYKSDSKKMNKKNTGTL